MNDELDPDLRRLFAATADYPADDAFLASVAAKTAPRRPMLRALAAALPASAVVIALALGLGVAIDQASAWIAPLVNGSPFGWAAGLALAAAGVVCFRLLAPLADRL